MRRACRGSRVRLPGFVPQGTGWPCWESLAADAGSPLLCSVLPGVSVFVLRPPSKGRGTLSTEKASQHHHTLPGSAGFVMDTSEAKLTLKIMI